MPKYRHSNRGVTEVIYNVHVPEAGVTVLVIVLSEYVQKQIKISPTAGAEPRLNVIVLLATAPELYVADCEMVGVAQTGRVKSNSSKTLRILLIATHDKIYECCAADSIKTEADYVIGGYNGCA